MKLVSFFCRGWFRVFWVKLRNVNFYRELLWFEFYLWDHNELGFLRLNCPFDCFRNFCIRRSGMFAKVFFFFWGNLGGCFLLVSLIMNCLIIILILNGIQGISSIWKLLMMGQLAMQHWRRKLRCMTSWLREKFLMRKIKRNTLLIFFIRGLSKMSCGGLMDMKLLQLEKGKVLMMMMVLYYPMWELLNLAGHLPPWIGVNINVLWCKFQKLKYAI